MMKVILTMLKHRSYWEALEEASLSILDGQAISLIFPIDYIITNPSLLSP